VTAHCDPCFAGGEKGAAEATELKACIVKGKRAEMSSLCSPGHVE
jgi:hypothetical protein